jgi:multicomponent Na+:H+ antiporter subunit E
MINLFVVNVILGIIWAALTGNFSLENLIIGFILGYLILLLTRRALGPTTYFTRSRLITTFILSFLWELVVANIRVAIDILRPHSPHIKPRVIAVPLETCNPVAVTLLANVVSLTPGTLSVDVSTERCILYVHAMYASDPDEARDSISNGFGRMVFDIFRHSSQDKVLEELTK